MSSCLAITECTLWEVSRFSWVMESDSLVVGTYWWHTVTGIFATEFTSNWIVQRWDYSVEQLVRDGFTTYVCQSKTTNSTWCRNAKTCGLIFRHWSLFWGYSKMQKSKLHIDLTWQLDNPAWNIFSAMEWNTNCDCYTCVLIDNKSQFI